ncbi:hypothetical protein C8R42DRAFT_638270 [Lentinula raphanica]|nr:hypothetical protein C8R42DRAFT_638270 [Lentinula raphanica]
MPTRNSFSVFLLATALLGLCAVVHPMPTPSSQPPSLPATPPNSSQIAPRADNPNPPRQPLEPLLISIGRLDASLPPHMISLRSPRTGSPNEYDALRIGQFVYLDLISAYRLRLPHIPRAPTPNDYNYFQPLAKAYFGSGEERNAVFRNLTNPFWVREKCHMQEFLYKNIDYLVCIANWLKTSDRDYVKPDDRSRMSRRLNRYMADRTADLVRLPLRLPLMMARIRPDGSWVPNTDPLPAGVTYAAVLLIGNEDIFFSPAAKPPNPHPFPRITNPIRHPEAVLFQSPNFYHYLGVAQFSMVARKNRVFQVLRISSHAQTTKGQGLKTRMGSITFNAP